MQILWNLEEEQMIYKIILRTVQASTNIFCSCRIHKTPSDRLESRMRETLVLSILVLNLLRTLLH